MCCNIRYHVYSTDKGLFSYKYDWVFPFETRLLFTEEVGLWIMNTIIPSCMSVSVVNIITTVVERAVIPKVFAKLNT